MNFIIFDLEATCWQGSPPGMVQEIIEIGAFKVDRYGEVKSSFNRFVRPVVNPFLSSFCQELTTIQQADVDRAKPFPKVIEAFQDWAGVWEDEYLLCSWGGFDKRMLANDCRLHRLEEDWTAHHINLKQQYHDLKRLKKTRGLKHAVEAEGFDFSGTHHRGLDDAANLVQIFIKFLDDWQY
ncbi:MAG: exonuclease domain-containing protein [Saprospiraceae bacterium]